MAGYQNKIPGSGADKLMIYDDTDGIGAKQIVSSLGASTSATNIPDVGAVKDALDGKQDTINGTAGYVMTGTGTAGNIGEKPIYGTSENYVYSLVTAETVNSGVINAVNSSLIRVDENGYPSNTGTLWEINTDLFALSTQPLPAGYTRLEYVNMDSGSYLLTNLVPTYDGKIEMDFKTTSLTSYSSVVGGRSVATTGAGLNFGYFNNKLLVDGFDSKRFTSNVVPTANTRYKFTFNNKVTTLESGGSILFTNTFTGTKANGAALVINGLNNAGTVVNNTAGIYLYSFKMWDAQGALTANYIPVTYNNTVGFYDIVSGTFKTATSGTFTAGPACVGPNLLSLNETKVATLASAIAVTKPTYAGVNQGSTWVVDNQANVSPNTEGIVIPVVAGDKYSVRIFNSTAFGAQGRYTYAEMNSSGVVTKGNVAYSSTISTGVTITAENTGFLCIQFAVNTTAEAVANAQIMVVKGETIPTEYRPYGENICD